MVVVVLRCSEIVEERDAEAVTTAFSSDVIDGCDSLVLDDKSEDNVEVEKRELVDVDDRFKDSAVVEETCASEVVEFKYTVDVELTLWKTVEE